MVIVYFRIILLTTGSKSLLCTGIVPTAEENICTTATLFFTFYKKEPPFVYEISPSSLFPLPYFTCSMSFRRTLTHMCEWGIA
jgi:hypothetical protein